jgi:guanylate kinase
MNTGLLFVLTAPSGCGKGSLRRALLAEEGNIRFCPSVTTRPPRPEEVDGEDYFFLSREEFTGRKDRGELCEHALVYGNYYGTPKKDIEDALKAGVDVILEKDVQGAKVLREVFPDGIFVFVLPPSFDELQRRIEQRGTEGEEQKKLRLQSARQEMADLSAYDYVIINADLDKAKDRLRAILAGERARFCANARLLPPYGQRRASDDKPTAQGHNIEQVQVQSSDRGIKKGEADRC